MKNFIEVDGQEKVTQKIKVLFEEIRGQVKVEDFSVILLITYLYTEEIISDSLLNSDKLKEEIIFKLKNETNSSSLLSDNQYQDLLNVFIPSIENIKTSEIRVILKTISNIDKHYLKEDPKAVFDNILHQVSLMQSHKTSEFVQPKAITEFISRFVGDVHDSRIYNPFSGASSLIKNFSHSNSILAQELNHRTWAIGVLRLLVHNVKADLRRENTLHNWPSKEKFDLILSTPPFQMKTDDETRVLYPQSRFLEDFLLREGVKNLSGSGKLVAVLSQGILYRGSHERQMREQLIKDDLIDTIISFPSRIFQQANIPFIIIVINKNKANPGVIRMINAEDSVAVGSRKDKVLLVDELLDLCSDYSNSEYVKIVSNETVKENDFNLSLPRYFVERIDGVKLNEVLSLVPGERVGRAESTGKFVDIRDLKDDIVDFKLDTSILKKTSIKRTGFRKINEPILLLSRIGSSLKPTYFEFTDEEIYISVNTLTFKVNEEVIDIAYLINELHSKDVLKQLDAFRVGSAAPVIYRRDLLNVKIKIPSIEEQRAKADGILEISNKIKQLEADKDALIQGVENKEYGGFAINKHTIGKPLLNIGSALRNIETALNKSGPEWQKIRVSERYDTTIKDSFDSMNETLSFIHNVLEKIESNLDLSNYKLQEIDFLEFLKGYVKTKKVSAKPNVRFSLSILPEIETELDNQVLLNSNEELMKIALDAFVENAERHAFTNRNAEYHLDIKLSLYFDSDEKESRLEYVKPKRFIQVEVANDGSPFPENYTLEKFITKGSKTGSNSNTGQGGFDINEIVKFHNKGKSSLNLLTDGFISEFVTVFSFLIPLN